jgi:formate hydrogenlyase subunit 3/multisubunit Na+/H+ antiporter MnhD subunit
MILSGFLGICAVGAAVSLLLAPERRLATLIVLASLALACAAALTIGPADRVVLGDAALAGTAYSGTFLATVAAAAFGLCLVTALAGGSVRAGPGALAALGGLGLAVMAADAPVALAGAAIAAVAAAGASVADWPAGEGPDNRTSEARTLALSAGGLLFAGMAISRPAWAGEDGPVLAAGLLALGAVLAVRSGAVPFHVPPARLAGHGASPTPALLTVWLPAGLGLLCVSWSAATFTNQSDWIELAAIAIRVVAVTTIALGGLGAIFHDAPAEIAVYSIVADSGFILLALASRSEAAVAPAREWLLVFIGAKTAIVAWAAAMSGAFGSADLSGLHGWLRRAPLAGLALLGATVAGVGWPGSAAFEARSTIAELGLPGLPQLVGPLAILLTAVCWGRVLIVGLLAPPEALASAARPRATARILPAWPVAEVGLETGASDDPAGALGADAPARRNQRTSSPAFDRSLAAGGAAAATAILALAITAGTLGSGAAAGSGIPLDVAARSTPTAAPTLTPGATTSVPTLAPHGTLSPSRPAASPTPSGSPGPTRSAAPPTIPQQ